ncbi:MAG: Flp pilus assembly protein CpaB [Desulfobaccales bacterium]
MANLPKGMTYMAVAVVAGLLATFGIHRYVVNKTQVAAAPTGMVAVATGDIAPGTALAGGSLKLVSWPKELIPPQCAAALNQVEGRVVTFPISSGEPIMFSKLAPVGTAAGLSSLLNESKRALTVRVDDVTGVAGFLHPRDRVDVLADMKLKGVDENYSKVILQDITVLSIGQIWQQTEDDKPKVVNAVTLELTPEQTEIVNLASNEGKIRLALRGGGNKATVETSGVAISNLFAGMMKPPPATTPQKEAKPEKCVEVIKGCERSKATL